MMPIPVERTARNEMDSGERGRVSSRREIEFSSPLLAAARVAGVVAVLLALAEVLIDWITEIPLNVSILFGLPLVVAAATRSRRLLWALTLFLFVTIFAVYYVRIPTGAFTLRDPYLVNRVLAACALVLTAALLHVGMIGLDLLETQRQSLEEQNRELEQRRREAEDANSRKTRILTSVSHDIRTPLQTITLMADILCRTADRPELTAQVPDVAHRLHANARALADLVGDVLDFARLGVAQGQLQLAEFPLNDLLTEEATRVRPLAVAKDLWLKAELLEANLRLRSDRTKLLRIVANLLGNAVKYTITGGVTMAASRAPDGAVLIRIADTGIGITPDQLEHIFDEFVQLRNPEGDRGKGHGLGLAICRQLAEALGANITVESQPGQGSQFTVRLPPSCVVETPVGGSARLISKENGRLCVAHERKELQADD